MVHCHRVLSVAYYIGHGLAWSRTSHSTSHISVGISAAETPSPRSKDNELSEDDIAALLRSKDTLGSYLRKPDCFQDSVALVKTRCEESHMNEQERVQAAISMTLCELATAHHNTPPLECAPFARGRERPSTSPAQAVCVEALSRSAQFWSSYSGYLREIPQLCFAFRRWIDIDVAKDIYRNITAEKATLVRFLMEREKNSRMAQQLWESTAEDMRDVVDALRLTSVGMKDASDSLTTTVRNSFQSVLADIENTLHGFAERDRTEHLKTIAKVGNMLETVGRDHSEHLAGLLPSLRSSIASQLNTALALIKDESLRNLDVADHVHRQLDLLENGLAVMHNSLQQLVGVVSHASRSLEMTVVQAQTAQAIQEETMVSMSHLIESVNALTQTTHAELEAINRTTVALAENLRRSNSFDWWKSALTSLLQLWPGVSRVNLLVSSQWLHLAFAFVNILWHVLYFSISLFTSVFVFVNAKHWMPPRCRITLKSKESPTPRSAPFAQIPQAALDMDVKPIVIYQPYEPRHSRRPFRPRYSRIPDRLCAKRPVDYLP